MCENQGDQKPNCIYYYCSDKRNQGEAVPFLRWLVSQLCQKKNDVPERVRKRYESGTIPDLELLLTILYDLLADLDHLFVVIEAVEQRKHSLFDPEDVGIPRRSLLKVVRTLMKDTRFKNLQLLITSRPDEHVKATMFGISDISGSISMSNLGVEEDVERYVQARLRSEPGFLRWPQRFRDATEHCFCPSAKRGFQWVDKMLHVLLECPFEELEDEIGVMREDFVEWASS